MINFFKDLFADGTSSWITILDFIIVYYMVYISLRLVKGTRTVPMVVGLLFLILMHAFSKQLGFITTYMLLDQFVSVVVIFTLIIFQDDIRRALVRFGKFMWFSKARETAVVEELVKATSMMTKKKIGALIVFEREALLDEFILEPGIRLDSNITKELLYTIFIPMMENPLHDGAVIIRSFQIREAGSFLPLSINPGISKSLGTRHRAGIGITESTDAVAVVVSEERGAVSICHDGKIIENLELSELRSELISIFTAQRASKKGNEEKTPSEDSKKELIADSIQKDGVHNKSSKNEHQEIP